MSNTLCLTDSDSAFKACLLMWLKSEGKITNSQILEITKADPEAFRVLETCILAMKDETLKTIRRSSN